MSIETLGVHHITLIGADSQTTRDFWEGVMGMPFVFEQPNLDSHQENHLYFDPGDGRLITVFCEEGRPAHHRPVPSHIGAVHHLAFEVTEQGYADTIKALDARNIGHSGPVDRGFMHSLYFREPLGMLIEVAHYKFTPPKGASHAAVLARAHLIRLKAGDMNIEMPHLEQAVKELAG